MFCVVGLIVMSFPDVVFRIMGFMIFSFFVYGMNVVSLFVSSWGIYLIVLIFVCLLSCDFVKLLNLLCFMVTDAP